MSGMGMKLPPMILQIGASTSKLRAGLAEASSLIRDWSLVTQGLTGGISNAFKTIASVGIKAVTIALAAMATSFYMVARSGAEFEDNILRAFVIMRESSGATARDLQQLTDTAIKMGSETLFSANEAATGLQTLARAGFSTKEAIEAIKPVVDLAIVGNLSLEESTNTAVASMYGFGLAAEDMARVSDVLSVASSQANTTVGLLGSSLSFVAPVARAAGLSIEETSAALGILSNAGIRGSRAGTTLRRALSVLLAPTGRAKKVFKELGLTFTDSSGKLEDFSTIMKKLEGASLTAAQTMEIFGLRAGPGMAALLATGSGELDKMTASLEGAEGAADRMSQEFRTTVKGRMRDLGASVVNLGLGFSQGFQKPLADSIFELRNYIKEITESWKKTKIFKAIVDGVIKAFSPLSKKIEELAQKFKEFLLGITTSDVSNFFDSVQASVQNFIDTVSDPAFIASVISAFQGAMASVMVFINMLIGLGEQWGKLGDDIKPVVAQVAGAVMAFTHLMGGIETVIITLITFKFLLTPVIIKILLMTGVLKTMGIASQVAAGKMGLLGIVMTGLGKIVLVLKALIIGLGSVIATVLASAAGPWIALGLLIAAVAYRVMKLTKTWEPFKRAVSSAVSVAIGWLNKYLKALTKAIDKVEWLSASLKRLRKALSMGFGGVFDKESEGMDKLVEKASKVKDSFNFKNMGGTLKIGEALEKDVTASAETASKAVKKAFGENIGKLDLGFGTTPKNAGKVITNETVKEHVKLSDEEKAEKDAQFDKNVKERRAKALEGNWNANISTDDFNNLSDKEKYGARTSPVIDDSGLTGFANGMAIINNRLLDFTDIVARYQNTLKWQDKNGADANSNTQLEELANIITSVSKLKEGPDGTGIGLPKEMLMPGFDVEGYKAGFVNNEGTKASSKIKEASDSIKGISVEEANNIMMADMESAATAMANTANGLLLNQRAISKKLKDVERKFDVIFTDTGALFAGDDTLSGSDSRNNL